MTEDPATKIQRLKKLLAQREAETAKNTVNIDSQELAVSDGKKEIEFHTLEEQEATSIDHDSRPRRLQGLTYGEIRLLECDQGLTEEEEEWLATKNIPNPDGSFRMPNLKAILKRTRKGIA